MQPFILNFIKNIWKQSIFLSRNRLGHNSFFDNNEVSYMVLWKFQSTLIKELVYTDLLTH